MSRAPKRGNLDWSLGVEQGFSNVSMGISSGISAAIFDTDTFRSNTGFSLDTTTAEQWNFQGSSAAGNDFSLIDPNSGNDILSLSDLDLSALPTTSILDPPVLEPRASELPGTEQTVPWTQSPPATNGASEDTTEASKSSTESSEEQVLDFQLSDLARKLVLHKSTYPPLSIHSTNQSFRFPTSSEEYLSPKRAYGYDEATGKLHMPSVSELFDLTQKLIGLYTGLAATPETPESASQINSEGEPQCHSRHADVPSVVSEATILLVLSCHHQVVSIWEHAFAHTNEMLRCGIFHSADYKAGACAPLKIGSFETASKTSVWSAVMSLSADLAHSLQQSVGKLTDAIRSNSPDHNVDVNNIPAGEDPTAPLGVNSLDAASLAALVPVSKAAHSRSIELVDKVNFTRELLLRDGILK